MIDVYKIGNTPEELQSAIIQLRQDFDSHNHDGVSSVAFQTLTAETISSRVMLIKKTSYTDTASGIWMGLVGNVMKLKLGSATANLNWDGTALNITGTITGSTITGGTIQTATSGERVVISATDKSLSLYDASAIVARFGINAGYVMQITPTASTNNGIQISSAQAGNGLYYSNSANVANRGIYVEQTSTGANNTLPGVEVHHDGSYYAYYAQATNASGGMILDIAGTGKGIYLLNAGTGSSIDIVDSNTGSGTVPAVSISYTRAGAALDIAVTHAGGNPTGIKMAINNSSGNEYAFEFAGAENVAAAVSGTNTQKIRVIAGGNVLYIPLYDA